MQSKLLSLAALAATASAQMMNLNQTLAGNPDLSNLTSYLSLFPQVMTQLMSAQNITILAPSNEAFSAYMNSSAGMAIKANDTMAIQALLTYHVLNGTYPAASIKNMPAFVPTMLTNPMYANVTGGQVVEAVNMGGKVTFFSGLLMNSSVVKADMNFTGGVVHVIDRVLTVPANVSTTAVDAGLSDTAGALMQANLVSAIDNAKDLTIFAPNNAAFEAIGSALPNVTMQQLAGILEYHVVNGTVGYSSTLTNNTMLKSMGGMNLTITINNGSVFVNSAKVVTPDVLVSNGVVHVIDNVLNPNMTMAMPSASATSGSAAYPGASSASSVGLSSGVATPTSTIGGGAVASGTAAGKPASTMSSSSSKGAAAPMKTGAVGAAALFGAAGVFMNV